MKNINLISWLSAQHEVHDISTIDKPEIWLYQESNGVYIPYEPIEYQMYTGQFYQTKTKEAFIWPCVTNEYALQLFYEGIQIWEGNDQGEKMIENAETLESCFDWGSTLFIELEDNRNLLQPVIEFEESESTKNKYSFTYLSTKNGLQIEADGYLEPYHTGRAIEHNIGIDSITVDNEEADIIEGVKLYDSIQEEVMNAFYNQVRI